MVSITFAVLYSPHPPRHSPNLDGSSQPGHPHSEQRSSRTRVPVLLRLALFIGLSGATRGHEAGITAAKIFCRKSAFCPCKRILFAEIRSLAPRSCTKLDRFLPVVVCI